MSQTASPPPIQEVENKAEPGSQKHTDPGRELFCQELVATGDKYASYEAAGFKRPRGNVDRMMREPDVAERIGYLYRKMVPYLEALLACRRDEHRRALQNIADADRLDLLVEKTRYVKINGKRRRYTALELKPLKELSAEQRALLDVKINDKGGIEILMARRLEARAMLAKLDGLEAPTKIAPTDANGDGPARIEFVTTIIDPKNTDTDREGV